MKDSFVEARKAKIPWVHFYFLYMCLCMGGVTPKTTASDAVLHVGSFQEISER